MWSGKIPHVIYYTLYNQHAWRREIVTLHSNHTRLGTVTLPLFHHMSNMTPKEVEETCPSCETWGVLGSWLKVTECQIAFIMNLNAKKTTSFCFLCSPKKRQILQSLCKVFWEFLKEFCQEPITLPRWLPSLLAATQIALLRLSVWRMIIALLWLDITEKAWKIFRESYSYK